MAVTMLWGDALCGRGRALGRMQEDEDAFTDGPMRSAYLLRQMQMRMRPSDVIINTLAKCGQTWLTALLVALKLRGDLSGLTHIFQVAPWLEVPWLDADLKCVPLDERIAQMEAVPDPRVFKMHVPWNQLPLPHDEATRNAIKIITITRDVRDLPYSKYRHFLSLRDDWLEARRFPKPDSFDDFFDGYISSGSSADFIASSWPHFQDPNVLVLRFEDLKHQPLSTTKQIIEFLGWEPMSDEFIEQHILPVVSIENMKEIQYTKLYPGLFKPRSEQHSFVREGRVGANRKKLSEEQLQRLRKHMEERVQPEALQFWWRDD